MRERKGWKVGTNLKILERCRRQDKTFCVRKGKLEGEEEEKCSWKRGRRNMGALEEDKVRKKKESGKKGNGGKGYGILRGGKEGKRSLERGQGG